MSLVQALADDQPRLRHQPQFGVDRASAILSTTIHWMQALHERGIKLILDFVPNLADQPSAAVVRDKEMVGRIIVSFCDREHETMDGRIDLRRGWSSSPPDDSSRLSAGAAVARS